MKRLVGFVACTLVVAACSSADPDAAGSTPTTTPTVPSTTVASTTSAAPTTTSPATTTTTVAATTTTMAPEPPITEDEGVYSIVWESVANPFWSPTAGTADDPYFFIHTSPDDDGFFFSLEMYTTGYGALWQGELGDVDVICNEAAPGPNSTGICPHFDPDGGGDLAADFATTGSITINRLDTDGYDIVVNELLFSDGSQISSFHMVGP